jgi:hypothetical protein
MPDPGLLPHSSTAGSVNNTDNILFCMLRLEWNALALFAYKIHAKNGASSGPKVSTDITSQLSASTLLAMAQPSIIA